MARTTTNMGLRLWNQSADNYNSQQLADNFAKIDAHDHTSGRGVPIGTGGIAAGAITSALLGPGSVTTVALASGSVTQSKIANGSVGTTQLDSPTATNVANAALGAWQPLALATGMISSRGGGLGGYLASARSEGTDRVRLKGYMNASVGSFPTNSNVATIPVGLRPSQNLFFIMALYTGMVNMVIDTAGNMTVSGTSSISNGSVLFLDGVTYTLS